MTDIRITDVNPNFIQINNDGGVSIMDLGAQREFIEWAVVNRRGMVDAAIKKNDSIAGTDSNP